jgi:hypothetical protein
MNSLRPHITYPTYKYKLKVRISTVDSHVGAAYIRPRPGYEHTVMPDQASFRKKNGHWHFRGRGGWFTASTEGWLTIKTRGTL